MELWNDGRLGFLRILSVFRFIVKTIMPLTQHSSIPNPIFPIFHHSNWGEAPNLFIGFRCRPTYGNTLSAKRLTFKYSKQDWLSTAIFEANANIFCNIDNSFGGSIFKFVVCFEELRSLRSQLE
jgi:hypothetical protein